MTVGKSAVAFNPLRKFYCFVDSMKKIDTNFDRIRIRFA